MIFLSSILDFLESIKGWFLSNKKLQWLTVLRQSIVQRSIETRSIQFCSIDLSVSDIGSATFDRFGTISRFLVPNRSKVRNDSKSGPMECETIERRMIDRRSSTWLTNYKYSESHLISRPLIWNLKKNWGELSTGQIFPKSLNI